MNAVIYARYSSHNQTEQSIEGQLRDAREYASSHDFRVVGEYIDRARSGRTDDRDSFLRMMSDAKAGSFEAVLVWKLDRFARNRYDSAVHKAALRKCGVRVISVMEPLTDTPESIILEGMLESMAEYYSANLAENVRRGLRETALKGRFTGGAVPFGYRAEDGRLVPDDATSRYAVELFERYAAGESAQDIADDFNRRGIRSSRGGTFDRKSFQSTLRSRVYIGEYSHDGILIAGCARQLISRELFERVQSRIERHRHAPGAGKALTEYALSGKLVCGHCGSAMHGDSGRSRTGDTHYYYSCSKRKKTHDCVKKSERKDALESWVIDRTVEYVLSPDHAADIVRTVLDAYRDESSHARAAELERLIAAHERDIDRAVDAAISAPASARERIYARIDELTARLGDLNADLAALRAAEASAPTEERVLAWLASFRPDGTSKPDRALIIDTFVRTVIVTNDYVSVIYNLPDTVGRETIKGKGLDFGGFAPPHPPKSKPVISAGLDFFCLVFPRP